MSIAADAPLTHTVNFLEVRLIDNHPLNPRPWSEKHGARVSEAKVKEIADSITRQGYDPKEPIIVRPRDSGRFEAVRGNQRLAAARSVGMETIPAYVVEMDDCTAMMELRTKQGEQIDAWCGAEHAYRCCVEGISGVKMTYEAYATELGGGVTRQAVGNWVQSYRVALSTGVDKEKLSLFTTRLIATLPEEDWRWFTELFLQKEWSKNQMELAVSAIKELKIPGIYQNWLPPLKYKRLVANDAAVFENLNSVKDIHGWIEAAETLRLSFPEEDTLYEFPDPKKSKQTSPIEKPIKPREIFVASLKDGNTRPNGPMITQVASAVSKQINSSRQEYSRWLDAQKTEADRLVEEARRREEVSQKKIEYSPIGINGDVNDVIVRSELRKGYQGAIDAAFIDPPASADYFWMDQLCNELLKPSGYVIVCCPDLEFREDIKHELEHYGLLEIQTLIWQSDSPIKINNGFGQDYQPVLIMGFTEEENHYFGSNELAKNKIKTAGSVFYIPAVPAADKIKSIEAQKPLKLAEILIRAYVPVDGLIYEPFAGSAPFSRYAKRLQRKAVWVEKDSGVYAIAESGIEQEKFFWE